MEAVHQRNTDLLCPASLALSPIDQVRRVATLAADPSLAFDLVLESVLQHFDELDPQDKQEALVLLIMSQKGEGKLSFSLQDILTTLSTVKNHRNASQKTIATINDFQDRCDLDLVLNCGIERCNQSRQDNPVSLHINWVEVITHQSVNIEDVKNSIVHYFEAINRDADKSAFIPSDHLVDTLITLALISDEDINSDNLYDLLMGLKEHPHATDAMKATITDYQKCPGFDKLAVRRKDVLINVWQAFVSWLDISHQFLSWKDWGILSQTCKVLNEAFHRSMENKLSKDGQLVVAEAVAEAKAKAAESAKRVALVKAFPDPKNRAATEIPINKEGIRYIQKELGIDCGPNTLIAIKKGQLSIVDAKKSLEDPENELQQ